MVMAQNLDQKISFKAKNKSLKEVITQIGNLAQINFSYSSQLISLDKRVDIKAAHKTVRSVLDELLMNSGLEYVLVENQVVIKMAKNTTVSAVRFKNDDKKKFTISGTLKDAATGEVLIGAYVFVAGSSIGTVSNGYGFYSLNLPTDHYEISYSFLGYSTIIEEIDLNENLSISKELQPVKTEMKAVEIVDNSKDVNAMSEPLHISRLKSRELSHLPGFAGDFDIIRTLQSVPGIKTYGDGSALFYVRGGNSDQNMILVDEAPIYNPSHLFGFFSAIAPDAINDAKIYKSNFPERYGGRLSSVIDIKIKEGNMKKFGFGGSLGAYTSYLSLEAPIKKEKCSFFVSVRKSTLSWLKYLTKTDRKLKLSFYDINAKINLTGNKNNRFYLSFYFGKDDFSRLTKSSFNTFGISWNNLLGSFRWNHLFNSRLFSNTTLYYSRYNYFLYLSKEQNNYWKSAITNMSGKSDFSWFINPNNTLRTGFQLSYQTTDPGNVSFSDAETQANVPEISRYSSLEYVLYAGNEQKIGKKIQLHYGFRLSVWQNMGPTNVYIFNPLYEVFDTLWIDKNKIYKTFFSPEPRFSLTYTITRNISLQLSYSHNSQFVHLLSNSVSPFTSLEVWVPSGPNIKPQKADQVSFTYNQELKATEYGFSIDGYYKRFYNAIDYKDHANMLFNPLLEGELRFGKGWSYGAEFIFRKKTGKITGWITYVYSRSFLQINGINNNEFYPANFDSPHNIFINFTYDTKKRWVLSANWTYFTGNSITTPVAFYYYNGYSVPVYGAKNNDRLPDYHRLDISVELRLNKPERKYQHSLIFSAYNAYAHKNPFSVNFNKVENNGNIVVPADNAEGFDLVPTVISVAGIIPSINYKFKF